MGPGTLFILAVTGVVIFSVLSRWHEAFGIFGASSILTSLFYGFIWLVRQGEYHYYRVTYGYEPPPYLHTALADFFQSFQFLVLFVVWGSALILFLNKLLT